MAKKNCRKYGAPLGFTLIEMMVTLGIMSIGGLAMMAMIASQLKAQRGSSQLGEINALHLEISSVLSDQASCLESFRNLNAMNTSAGVITSLKKLISKSPPTFSNIYLTQGQPGSVSRGGVNVVSYSLKSTSDSNNSTGIYLPADESYGTTELWIQYQREVQGGTPIESVRRMKLGVYVDPANQFAITGCQAYGVPLNNYVDGDLTITGNVLVGRNVHLNYDATDDPDDCGHVGSTPSTSQAPVGEGKIRYDKVHKSTEFCDGYKWYPSSSPEVSPLIGTRSNADAPSCRNPQGVSSMCNSDAPHELPVIEVSGWCPPGFGLIQVSGRSGWAIDNLSMVCRHYQSGQVLAAASIGSASGGNAFTGSVCPAESFVTRLAVRTSTSQKRGCGYTITGLKYWCTRLDRPDIITQTYVHRGNRSFSGEYWQSYTCPRGEVVHHVKMQASRSTDFRDPADASPVFSGTDRQNCDCRSCIANLQFRCGFLDRGITSSEP